MLWRSSSGHFGVLRRYLQISPMYCPAWKKSLRLINLSVLGSLIIRKKFWKTLYIRKQRALSYLQLPYILHNPSNILWQKTFSLKQWLIQHKSLDHSIKSLRKNDTKAMDYTLCQWLSIQLQKRELHFLIWIYNFNSTSIREMQGVNRQEK